MSRLSLSARKRKLPLESGQRTVSRARRRSVNDFGTVPDYVEYSNTASTRGSPSRYAQKTFQGGKPATDSRNTTAAS